MRTHAYSLMLAACALLALLSPACATVSSKRCHVAPALENAHTIQPVAAQEASEAAGEEKIPKEVLETISASTAADDCGPGVCPQFLCDRPTLREHFKGCAWDFLDEACADACHFYSKENLCCLGLGVAIAAPLANTSADRHFSDWYQNHVRSPGTDDCSRWAKLGGNHWLAIPVYLAADWGGKLCDDTCAGSVIHTWGDRTLRAALVGAPSVGVLQYALGAARPDEGDSRWRPFQDNNGVAGHGFMGALPFLAAASLTDKTWLCAPLFAASFATDWSRINDDGHYLSQAALGWWIAYLSVKCVKETDRERNCYVLPCCGSEGPGMSVLIRY